MSSFLKREDPNMSKLKEKYFKPQTQDKRSAFQKPEKSFQHWSEIETYIDRNKRTQMEQQSYRMRFNKWLNDWFKIKVDGRSIYVWHARRLQEVMFMHIPRFIFLGGSIYTIFKINLRQHETNKAKQGVISHRQEEINKQLQQIEKVLKPTENNFEPGK